MSPLRDRSIFVESKAQFSYDQRVMPGEPPLLSLAMMSGGHVPAVLALESTAFVGGWPSTAFERELQQNKLARYIVLFEAERLVGFAGLWLMVEEAHIVTVAVAPPAQRLGYGRLLVQGLLRVADREGMLAATLEVRESNAAARALYRDLGFHEAGKRKRYYSDNREDAVIMTTEEFASEGYRRAATQAEARLAGSLPTASSALESL